MQNERKYLVLVLMLLACGSVGWLSEQWGECRVAVRELQQCVRRYEREHRVSPKLECKIIDLRVSKPCLSAKQNNEHTALVKKLKARYQVKLSMKRFGNLFDQVASIDNIERAFLSARKGKLHYKEVHTIGLNPQLYYRDLHRMLTTGTYTPSDYTIFERKSGNKTREIYRLPFYPDRMIHHCIVQIMQPIWMNVLIRDTYSTIPGRGIHDGAKRIQSALSDTINTVYCLKIDVKKFYPSVDHAVLHEIIARKVKDQRLMSLIDQIIESAPGIPIGNYISQWFGNIYLAYFDHYVKEELGVKYYFRYCDDMVFLDGNKDRLWDIFAAVKSYLNDELKLQVKHNYQVFPVEKRGIDFLGYRFYHSHTIVRKGIVKAFKKMLLEKGSLEQKQKSAYSYYGWFVHANSKGLIHKYFDDETKLLRASTRIS